MNKISFKQLAIDVLKVTNRPMTPKQMWDFAGEQGWHERLDTFNKETGQFSGKTPDVTFCRTVYTDNEVFECVFGTKPKQYQLKNRNNSNVLLLNDDFLLNNGTITDSNTQYLKQSRHKGSDLKEQDLHPVLCAFLKNSAYFKAYSKTIFHESSSKSTKGADRWLYPDMVAVNFEYANYQGGNVLNFIKKFDILPIKIFSFEIKRELNFSNYKESFFQAVSNSSWANEGYLVALDIKKDGQFIEALQKLSQSFGIGVIELNLTCIDDSKIVSPAKFKEKMDYSVVDELASKNNHFKQFLKTVTDFDVSNPKRFLDEFDKISTE